METKRRWMIWVLRDTKDAGIVMPWARGSRRAALRARREAA